jgi:peptide/nickel transport system permease protein
LNLRFLATRFGRSVLTLLLVVGFIFAILRVAGDPAQVMAGDDAPPELVERYRVELGLDRTMPEQFLRYVVSLAGGDFGRSFKDNRPALGVVVERLPVTLQLGLVALVLSVAIGVPLGVFAALKRGSAIDRFAMTFAVLGYSLPNFFLAILLILLFSLHLRWLPSSGSDTLWHMVMPAITLGTAHAGGIARFTRSAMLEVLNRNYMRTAKAKGVPRQRRLYRHALPNAAIPVVTHLGFRIGHLVAGAIIVETVFAWPGVGRLMISAVAARDLAVVQTLVLMTALAMIAANLLVDLAYGWIDPRIRVAGDRRET